MYSGGGEREGEIDRRRRERGRDIQREGREREGEIDRERGRERER